MGRVQQKLLFSHFSVLKCKIWKEIMNIWNCVICVWQPPTLIHVLISYVKEIRFWNQYPSTFYAISSKSMRCNCEKSPGIYWRRHKLLQTDEIRYENLQLSDCDCFRHSYYVYEKQMNVRPNGNKKSLLGQNYIDIVLK